MSTHRGAGRQVSGWAIGGVGFAACILILIGAFQTIAALTAIFDDKFFPKTHHYTFHLSAMGWGWIHLVIGLAVLWTGISLFRGQNWAAVAGIVLAMFSAIAFFFFIPFYPVWSIVVIALDVWVIWALSTPGAVER
jgi:hypothetical protein